jgi:hypothetical protein
MGQKSIQVPQPEFSNWVIRKRQELNLSPSCLRKKVGGKLSERTLKYIEDGKKNSFSEYTLNALAQGLELGYPELLEVIDSLNSTPSPTGFSLKKFIANRLIVLAAPVLLILFLWLFLIGKNGINNKPDHRIVAAKTEVSQNQRIAEVEIHADYPHIIIAFDDRGEKLWMRNVNTRIKKVAMSDLDGNASIEVIAATCKELIEDKDEKPGWLFVWDAKGTKLAEYNLWKASIYPAHEPRASIADFKIADLENDGILEIAVAVHGEQYYPSRIAVLHFQNSKFEEVKSYWNPGYVLQLFIEDVDEDGLPEIICTGVNNDFKRVPEFGLDDNVYSIFMLKGTEIYGQAPPYLGDEQIGSEIWYRYITPTSRNDIGKIVDVTFMEKRIHVKLKNGCFFYLDYAGNLVDTFDGDECTSETELHFVSKGKPGEGFAVKN